MDGRRGAGGRLQVPRALLSVPAAACQNISPLRSHTRIWFMKHSRWNWLPAQGGLGCDRRTPVLWWPGACPQAWSGCLHPHPRKPLCAHLPAFSAGERLLARPLISPMACYIFSLKGKSRVFNSFRFVKSLLFHRMAPFPFEAKSK